MKPKDSLPEKIFKAGMKETCRVNTKRDLLDLLKTPPKKDDNVASGRGLGGLIPMRVECSNPFMLL